MVVATIVTKAQDQIPSIKGESSIFKITDRGSYPNISDLKVFIKDNEGFAMSGYVCLRDNENRILVKVFADKKGEANLMVYDLKDVKTITIDYMGYNRVVIPIARLRNRSSTIEAKLFGQSTSD
ncbi:hypothetical protein LPB86_12685 [Pedobacter sp. MC2016-14]|uniref:hypothetical protein n=1 Tax=Pedobacter sp. MC2016-14 TaxID=2897327 RepID=UPI001E5F5261|nr:hypothetical protein [Pedobacter sp. MC2016-14]MCD0489089.1 hypothetical protein [Pedobacter sp. MC2016-14]